MSYTVPISWSTGQIVTASQLNEQIKDNMTYVHDALYTVAYSNYTSTTRVPGTTYQNTTGKIMMLNVMGVIYASTSGYLVIRSEASSPPLAVKSYIGIDGVLGGTFTITAIIKPSEYYRTDSGVYTPYGWVEWTIG